MRRALKPLAACAGIAAAAAIAGCGPASAGGLAQTASEASATPPASIVVTPSPTPAQSSAPAAAVPAASPSAAAGPGGVIPMALSIGMTLPVRHPAQTTAVIGGRLTEPTHGGQPIAGRLVWLQRLGAGGWLVFRSHVTGPDGRVVFRVHVAVGAAFRLVFRGTPYLGRAVSTVRIVVR